MRSALRIGLIFMFYVSLCFAIALPGFTQDKKSNEQYKDLIWNEEIDVHINAPGKKSLKKHKETIICFYACPAGNTIDWTIGKKMEVGDDWHYDIQHIGAQTRFIRKVLKAKNLIVIYVQPKYRTWQLFDDKHPDDYIDLIQNMFKELLESFENFNYTLSLNGHSAGGSWILRYLQGVDEIPEMIDRISFMDSNYNYKYDADHYDTLLENFLLNRDDSHLCVMAYNDSVALYRGKPVVSAQGGTWWNSKLMLKRHAEKFSFEKDNDIDLQRHYALGGRYQILLKENYTGAILHTIQVYKNGFIHSMLSGTEFDEQDYKYYGEPAYLDFVK